MKIRYYVAVAQRFNRLKTLKSLLKLLVAQVLRENPDWMFCGEIAEKTLALLGKPQFVDMGDKHYKTVNRILVKLRKRGIVESGLKFWRLKPLK